ncbi:MAG: hypothetical protein WA629_04985 [Candidatus Aquilonibacter sp.]
MSVDRALRPDFHGLPRSIVISIVLPAILVQILIRVRVPLIAALAIAAIFPLGAAILAWRRGIVDVIAIIGLLFIIVGVATSFVSADPRYALVAGSLGSAIFGAVCLVSLLAPRPAMFAIAKGAAGPDAYATFEELWRQLTAIVSPALDAAAIVGLIAWTILYVRNARKRAGLAA